MGRHRAKIRLKRAYDEPSGEDGTRILVERLWPRGLSKEKAAIDLWLREIAPSTELRRWYGHDPEKWDEFRKRYWAELGDKADLIESLEQRLRGGPVTFVYAARDVEHNSAVALKEYLERGSRA